MSQSQGASAPNKSEFHVSRHINALDLLSEANRIAEFVQSITLLPEKDGEIHLSGGQITGLFYVMQDLMNRISKAMNMLDSSKEGQNND